jgi:hypothetical protein
MEDFIDLFFYAPKLSFGGFEGIYSLGSFEEMYSCEAKSESIVA